MSFYGLSNIVSQAPQKTAGASLPLQLIMMGLQIGAGLLKDRRRGVPFSAGRALDLGAQAIGTQLTMKNLSKMSSLFGQNRGGIPTPNTPTPNTPPYILTANSTHPLSY